MSLTDDIAKLPQRGNGTDWLKYLRTEPRCEPYESIADAWEADMALLRLAREWIADAHKDHCLALSYGGVTKPDRCDCGRTELLAAMEEPR